MIRRVSRLIRRSQSLTMVEIQPERMSERQEGICFFSIRGQSRMLCINDHYVEDYYTMKICLAWRVARLESSLHSADIGVVWGANLPLRSRARGCGLLIGLVGNLSTILAGTMNKKASSTVRCRSYRPVLVNVVVIYYTAPMLRLHHSNCKK